MSSSPVKSPAAAVQLLELLPVFTIQKGSAPRSGSPFTHALIFPTPIPISGILGGSTAVTLTPSDREPADVVILAESSGLPIGSDQVGPAKPGASNEVPLGPDLAARLGFCLGVTESSIVVASIQLAITSGDAVVYQTLPNSDFAKQPLAPLHADNGTGAYTFVLNDAAVGAAGQFLTSDCGILIRITLEKPTPPPLLVALPSGSLVVFKERPNTFGAIE